MACGVAPFAPLAHAAAGLAACGVARAEEMPPVHSAVARTSTAGTAIARNVVARNPELVAAIDSYLDQQMVAIERGQAGLASSDSPTQAAVQSDIAGVAVESATSFMLNRVVSSSTNTTAVNASVTVTMRYHRRSKIQ